MHFKESQCAKFKKKTREFNQLWSRRVWRYQRGNQNP